MGAPSIKLHTAREIRHLFTPTPTPTNNRWNVRPHVITFVYKYKFHSRTSWCHMKYKLRKHEIKPSHYRDDTNVCYCFSTIIFTKFVLWGRMFQLCIVHPKTPTQTPRIFMVCLYGITSLTSAIYDGPGASKQHGGIRFKTHPYYHPSFNTLRPRQDGRHFPDDIFKKIFLNGNVWIAIKFSLKFVPKGSINNIQVLVQIMAWSRLGDKPLSEPMMANLLTHICVTRPQWVNTPRIHKFGQWALTYIV